MNINSIDELSDEDEQGESGEMIQERVKRYLRESEQKLAAIEKELANSSELTPRARKHRLLDPLSALIAAKQDEEARRGAVVEARIQEAIEKAIARERAITN